MAKESIWPKAFQSELGKLKGIRNSFLVMVGVGIIVGIMLMPLPAFLLDVLMASNLAFGIIVVLIVLMNNKAIQFSIFPQLLLISTVFSLALNISSTRLILSKGKDFDGSVVRAFASFVVGGSGGAEALVIGVIIFVILVAVQYIVITKGATRVSEVAARFTLESLTSKFIALDGEFAQGLMSEEELQNRKKVLQKESDFYGAMDGATKFVSGNVQVGFLITAINIIGGLVIGIVIKGYPASTAIQEYLILTVGDGLVSQFPALFISVATGLIVTRSISDQPLGDEIQEQFSTHLLVYYVSGVFIIVLGVFTSFSLLIFGPIGLGLIYNGYRLSKSKKDNARLKIEEEVSEETQIEPVETPAVSPPNLLFIGLGYGLLPFVMEDEGKDLLNRITKIRREIANTLGLVVPKIRIADLDIDPDAYSIQVNGIEMGTGILKRGRLLAIHSGMVVEEIEGEETVDPTFNLPSVWIREDQRALAERSGYTVVDGPSIIVTHLSEVIKQNADELLGRQKVYEILEALNTDYSALIKEVRKDTSVGKLQKVLKGLLKERVSIRNMVSILETVADYGAILQESYFLVEKVRQKLGTQIVYPLLDHEKRLNVLTLSPIIENHISETAVETINGLMPGVSPEYKGRFLAAMQNSIMEALKEGLKVVLLTSERTRPVVRQLVVREFPQLTVLSTPEIPEGVQLISSGVINMEERKQS